MNANERMLKIVTATPAQLAQVDAVLEGRAKRPDEETRLLPVSQAARLLGVSRMTVYRLKAQGRLTAVLLGGSQSRITLASVQALAAGKATA